MDKNFSYCMHIVFQNIHFHSLCILLELCNNSIIGELDVYWLVSCVMEFWNQNRWSFDETIDDGFEIHNQAKVNECKRYYDLSLKFVNIYICIYIIYVKTLSYILINLQCIKISLCLSSHLTEYFYNLNVHLKTLSFYCSSTSNL